MDRDLLCDMDEAARSVGDVDADVHRFGLRANHKRSKQEKGYCSKPTSRHSTSLEEHV